MSAEKKVELISSVKDKYGLVPALRVLDLPRATWCYHEKQKIPYEEKYAHIRPILEDVLREPPSYGIPRITPELRERYGRRINHKEIQELLHLWDLSMIRKAKKPRPSGIRLVILAAGDKANLVKGMAQIQPFKVSYTLRCHTLISRRSAMLMATGKHISCLSLVTLVRWRMAGLWVRAQTLCWPWKPGTWQRRHLRDWGLPGKE